jgi:hypothetical protein
LQRLVVEYVQLRCFCSLNLRIYCALLSDYSLVDSSALKKEVLDILDEKNQTSSSLKNMVWFV